MVGLSGAVTWPTCGDMLDDRAPLFLDGIMSLTRSLAAVLLLVAASPAAAQTTVGGTVTLVVRDNHIPAHPGDGDPHISVRFTSGSTAKVDEIGNWIRVTGSVVGGGTATGWIVSKYIASGTPPVEITFPELEWCPAKGSAAPHASGRLRIATWNIATLHAQDGQAIYANSVRRQPVDYDRIRCYTRLLDADILAVQEVDGVEALERVVDTDVYDLIVSSRSANQNTGFAFKKGLNVTKRPDFQALDVGSVRYGTRIDLTHNGRTLKLMSVHLKSGCFPKSSSPSSDACQKLEAQIPILENWIDAAANGPDPFIVLGDFNRRLEQDGDLVWAELDDGVPANADLVAAGEDMPISCRDNFFTDFIDQIVFDKRAAVWFDPTSFRQMTFRQADRDSWDLISDHCPVVAELWIR